MNIKEHKESADKIKKKKRILLISFAVSLLALLPAGFFCYRVELVKDAVTIELGSEPSQSPFDYLEGFSFAVERSTVDMSGVETYKTGTYEATVRHAWQEFSVMVTVEDTTPPELELNRELQYLLRGKTYPVDEFVTSAKDLSGQVSIFIQLSNQRLEESVAYNRNGERRVVIVARDINENETVRTMPVIVDTAPVIGGDWPEYHVAVGSEIDYLEGLYAWDEHDGDLTDRIVYDASAVNLSLAGEYEINYSVTDGYGFEGTATNILRVYEKMDLQQLINTHQINPKHQKIIGAYNPYDGGVYEEDDIDSVLEKMTPAFVCLKHDLSNGSWTRGSGFIAEITEDEIVIVTNEHVVHKYQEMDVYFYDGTKAKARIISTGAAACTEKDIAFARVDRSNLPKELLDSLITVHIEEGYWAGLSQNPDISAGVRCLLDRGEVWYEDTGRLTVKKAVMSEAWRSYGLISHVTVELIPGVSGSAILDGHGRLIAMAVGHGRVKGVEKYFAVTLDNIIRTYEQYIGHKPNYM